MRSAWADRTVPTQTLSSSGTRDGCFRLPTAIKVGLHTAARAGTQGLDHGLDRYERPSRHPQTTHTQRGTTMGASGHSPSVGRCEEIVESRAPSRSDRSRQRRSSAARSSGPAERAASTLSRSIARPVRSHEASASPSPLSSSSPRSRRSASTISSSSPRSNVASARSPGRLQPVTARATSAALSHESFKETSRGRTRRPTSRWVSPSGEPSEDGRRDGAKGGT